MYREDYVSFARVMLQNENNYKQTTKYLTYKYQNKSNALIYKLNNNQSLHDITSK